MKKRLLLIILAGAMAGALLAGCNSTGGQQTADSEGGGDTLKIGVCYCSTSAPAVQVFAKGIQEKAKELGVEIVELDAGFDATKQTDQMNTLISQKVDGIVLNPVDGKSVVPSAKAAKEAGIPVVMGAMDIDESGREYVVSFVGADDKDVGKAAGERMIEELSDGGQVAIVEGTAGTSATTGRTEGFEEAVAGSNIEVVTKLAADFDKSKAMTVTEDILTKYPDLAGIWVHDDTMCVGVVQAMKSMGYTGDDIKVISYNGSKNGANMVKNGEIVATSVQPLVEEGKTSVDVLVKAINGEEVDSWYKDTIEMLDADNVDDYDESLLW